MHSRSPSFGFWNACLPHCATLRHTATHWNHHNKQRTMEKSYSQHTVTHCNTLQHTTTRMSNTHNLHLLPQRQLLVAFMHPDYTRSFSLSFYRPRSYTRSRFCFRSRSCSRSRSRSRCAHMYTSQILPTQFSRLKCVILHN